MPYSPSKTWEIEIALIMMISRHVQNFYRENHSAFTHTSNVNINDTLSLDDVIFSYAYN